MNINASIIDQRLNGVQDEIRARAAEELGINDPGRVKSLAFVYLAVKTMLDLDPDEAFDCLTEGGGDFGVDAMHFTEEVDGEFAVTLFQAKHRAKLDAQSSFEEKGIEALIRAIRHIFDPASELGAINDRLRTKVEAARSLIRDGFIPHVRAIACNNGKKWNDSAQTAIERTGFGEQVSWEYVNHDVLINILQRQKPVDATLRLTGKAIVEDMNYSRVCIGRIPVTELAELMKVHGERLLERNIRRYLGLHGNRVNEGIRSTLYSSSPANFYFYPLFVRYASCFIAMQMGRHLLKHLGIALDQLDHRNFTEARARIEQSGEAYFQQAVTDVHNALHHLYGGIPVSMQQLSATFRRGDLIGLLRAAKP